MASLIQPTAASAPALQHFTLDNGLAVYLREDHRAPLASAQLWYHVGASYEPPGHSGLSHLLEHLMFEGSSKLEPGEYSTLITRIGGEPNAATTQDATYFPVTLPSNRLEVALEAMADAMASASFEQTAFDREIEVVRAERRSHVDNNALALAMERANSLAMGTSAYATPVIGTTQDLADMTAAAVRTWYQSWYHPNNASLVVVGDVTLGRLREWVERHFGAIPANRLPDRDTPRQSTPLQQRTQTVTLPHLREGLIMNFNVPSLATASTEQEAYALRLIPAILTEGSSSRLSRRLLREQEVLHAKRSQYLHHLRGDSLLTFYFFNNPLKATPEQAMEHVWAEIDQLRQSPPSDQELTRAKARLLAGQVFSRDDLGEQAFAIGQQAASGVDPHQLDREAQSLQSVTAEAVRDAAHRYLTRERLTVTYMTEGKRP
ncbi:pitrilysin family protein [Pseudomonas sp. Teo4]|uniref:M16 family metallopeptidase n=1 Tax=Pseudomonas sp. Teo4 TaxID=3064528 RepID=UPI002AB8BD2F|nr:pitrilysin family protein [Pseudomonas sp. Teo4]MDZ3994268.1 putative zinc protease [Pseudomonas sp. Teo4]